MYEISESRKSETIDWILFTKVKGVKATHKKLKKFTYGLKKTNYIIHGARNWEGRKRNKG